MPLNMDMSSSKHRMAWPLTSMGSSMVELCDTLEESLFSLRTAGTGAGDMAWWLVGDGWSFDGDIAVCLELIVR